MSRARFNLPPLAQRTKGSRHAGGPIATVLVLVGLVGCGIADPSRDVRGARLDPHQVAEIVPGVQTRADVAALLGTPSATAPFGDDAWFYVSSVTRNRVGRVPSIEQQTVVAIRFDENGKVREVKTLGLADAADIDPVQRETPSPGTERNFLQLLLGNIGRFGTGAPTRVPGTGF